MTKKEEGELWLIELFQRLNSKYAVKNITKQESPDFIAESPEGKIGIELTEVFQKSDSNSFHPQQFSSDSASFTDKLINEIQPHVSITFIIGIEFSKFHFISKSSKHKIIQKTKEICIPALLELQDNQSISLDFNSGLPEEINSLDFFRYDKMNSSFNSKPEGGSICDLTIEHLKSIISKKEQKIGNYSLCDNYWLLIREGNYYAGTFKEVKIQTPITSSFDRVFLLRTITNELIELK